MLKYAIGLAAALMSTSSIAAPIQWTAAAGGNDHWYEFITAATTWDQARTNAAASSHMGLSGHLVTLTSTAEKNFVFNTVSGGQTSWIGAERVAGTNSFRWAVGPEAGTVFYNNGAVSGQYQSFHSWEPNGLAGGENNVEMWGNGWNDLPGHHGRAYVVEYSQPAIAPVPLPATGLMLVAGLGLLAARRRANA